jgi:hypothetical protein
MGAVGGGGPLIGRLATGRLLVPESAKPTIVQRQDILTPSEAIGNSIDTGTLRFTCCNASEQ